MYVFIYDIYLFQQIVIIFTDLVLMYLYTQKL